MSRALQRALWAAASVALLTLLFLTLSQSPPRTGNAVVPEPRAIVEAPEASRATSLADALPEVGSGVAVTEHGEARPREEPAPLAGAGQGEAPYTVHFQVVWKFAPQLEPGAVVRSRSSKVVLCAGMGPRVLVCDKDGTVSTRLSPLELALAIEGEMHCAAVAEQGCSSRAVPIAILPAGETRVSVPIDREWPSCVLDFRFSGPDGITDMLQIDWHPMHGLDTARERAERDQPCDHGIDLAGLVGLRGSSGQISHMGTDLPRRIQLFGVAEGLTQVNVALVRRNPFTEVLRTALVHAGEAVQIDLDRSWTERIVTISLAGDGPATAPGALELSVAGFGWERTPVVEIGRGPRADMKLWAPAAYQLRVTEAGSDFTCRKSHFVLDANGRVIHKGRLLSVSGDGGREVINVALGRRLEITPTRLRELRALCESIEIVLDGVALPVHLVRGYGGAGTYLDELESKLRGLESNVRVYAPEEAKIVGRSTEDGSREVTMNVGSWFQE